MGKRELFIIAAFSMAGLLAYVVSAPAESAPGRRFSLSRLLDEWRGREGRGAPSRVSTVHRATIAVGDGTRELRFAGLSRLAVIGEARSDIQYELTVETRARDTARAKVLAERATLTADDVGTVLSLRGPASPDRDTSVSTRLLARVPSRLDVRIEGSQSRAAAEVSSVRSVALDSVLGDVTIRQIDQQVSGTHRNGDLSIDGAGAVRLALAGSNSTIRNVREAISLTTRSGRSEIVGASGPTEVETTGETLRIVDANAPVRVSGTSGQVVVESPRQPVTVNMRGTLVDIRLTVPVDVTAFTSSNPLRLSLPSTLQVVVDAAASEGGSIDASDFSLSSRSDGDAARLTHRFAGDDANVALRNSRGAIVISERK